MLLQSESNTDAGMKCRFCYSGPKHNLPDCKVFKKALRKDRWRHVKRYGICYKCLSPTKHDRDICPAPACDKNNCGQAHHRLLHYEKSSTGNDNTTGLHESSEREPTTEAQQVTHIKENNRQVLLKVVTVQIHGPIGTVTTAALLDDGSTVTLMNSELAARVGLRRHRKTMRVRGAWDTNELECDSEIVNFTASNKDGQLFTLTAHSVSDLNLPAQDTSNLGISRYGHISQIKNQLNLEYYKPQLLIGQDNYHVLLPLQVLEGKPGEPFATLTPLGWCLHGCTRTQSINCLLHSTLLLSSNHCGLDTEKEDLLREIHEEVRRSFAIDSLGVTAKPRGNSDDLRAQAHLEKTCKLIQGRWYVGLPWRDSNAKMPNSFTYAMSRLKGIEKKVKADVGYASRYKERIEHLFQNNYAKQVVDISWSPRTWYLPHFGVDNPNKKKLRLVFDAAAKFQNVSLNDYLLKGPDLLVSLLNIE
ncbi:uncharacterized protein LOC120636318 [Pararge aegeria]|uniref:uncharacterized protein LOC120636318 n=1 Tax=Pararge aegeria TaxID=116150 RepID=UPI0019D0B192|nr:uncharacterized protein LOC120636318 [Pararge aegeria]